MGTAKPGARTSRSCPGSSHAENGGIPCWKDHAGPSVIACGRNWNNAMGDGIVNSCALQDVVWASGREPAKAHVDNERGIAELAIGFEISQIHDCTSYSGRPSQPRFAVLFHGNNRRFRRYSVESRGERRIRQIVSKSENDAGDRESVTISIPLPFFRLARNCPSFSPAAPKTSSELHGNSLFREISPPVKRQSGVDHADVNSVTVITNDARRSRAEIRHVHCVQVPIVCAIGEVV